MKLKWAKVFNSLKLITSWASEYFTIFTVRKSAKKDGLKTRRSLFD